MILKNIHLAFKNFILQIIDFFYPFFKNILPLKKFRYLVCGGGNTLLDIILYYFTYNFLFIQNEIHIFNYAISRHLASFWPPILITFPLGFYLSMFVVFSGSHLKRSVQFIRYFMVISTCIFLNYSLLKIFVEKFDMYPPLATALSVALVVTFSYLSQMYFSFKGNKS